MGDSETLLAQTSATLPSGDPMDVSGGSLDAGGSVQATELIDHPATLSNAGETISPSGNLDGNKVDATMLSSIHQEAPTSVAYETEEKFDGSLDTSLVPNQVSGYDTAVNSNGVSEGDGVGAVNVPENGVVTADGTGSAVLHQPMDGSGLSPEEERLWSIVTTNSLDFTAWTSLIEETERMSEGNILKIRKVYDSFLAEFPLCYGYWKKYADHEARLSSVDKVAEVYERAIQGVTYSVDMWLHYCVFSISTYGDPEIIRGLFERALAYVGTDYLCFPLWDKYMEYEMSQQDWPRVATIYTRVLEAPNQQMDRYFEGFKELVASRPLSELRTAEEIAASVSNSEAIDQEHEGEAPGAIDQSSKPLSATLQDAENLEKYIAVREEIYKKAKEIESKIIGFETAIRRPYFHVRPLNVAELENWHNYLDFIEGGGDLNKIVKLYERCLIACANYPDYWVRYILCMEASGSMELAENALARATQVFVKRQPEIHLFAARFKEQHGDISGARAAYQLVHTGISPGLLEAIIKHANMEQRLGKTEDACSIYEEAISIEKGKEHSQTLPLLFAQYSRFIFLVSGKADRAREILDRGVENAQLSKPLLEAMIHLESIHSLPKRVEYLDSLVGKFVVPDPNNPNVASVAEREELSSIFLEFLDLFGDVESIKKADNRHAKLFLHHKSTAESKKRNADDYLVSDKTKLAKSLISSAAPATSAYPSAQNQWAAAGYGAAQPQAWPQASQAQAPQWGPGYAQQATYGAYGNYASGYAAPQPPTSTPQVAAYGAYPPTYPAQAYPQQAYTQPAAVPAPALTPVQQPAAVPSAAYYGGSYY